MDCSRFERILADFAEGNLGARDQAVAELHLGNCRACRQLLSTAMGQIDLLPDDAADELARSILDSTSGSVCPRVESRLWDFCAGELSLEDAGLMALHLDHCPGCRSLAAALAEAQQVLPAMAEIEPDGSFTSEIVWATSGCRTCQVDFWAYFLSWLDRMIKRPHFALEAAYVGTLVLAFVFSSPFLPFWSRLSSEAFQPSAQYLASVWTATTDSVSAGVRETASAVTSKSRMASGSIREATTKYGQLPIRLGREARIFQMRCHRGAAATFSALSAQIAEFLQQSRT